MKASSFHDLWASPDNTRLTPKQFSFRLPTHVAAKLAALCEMYPTKSRTQIVADLLTHALDDVEAGLPMSKVECTDEGPLMEEAHFANEERRPERQIFEGVGPKVDFRRLANKHYEEIERELGNESPERLYRAYIYGPASDFE